MTELVRYEAAVAALAEALAVDEVQDIRDEWRAIEAASRIMKNTELELQAMQIRFRAQRRLGELIIKQEETVGLHRGGRPRKTDSGEESVSVPTLREAGISPKESMNAQRLARLPAEDFEDSLKRHAEEVRSGKAKVATDLMRVNSAERGAEHRRNLAQTLSDASAQLAPSGRRYPVIYADPAWRRHQGVTDRSYENHYPTMTWDDICALPVADMVLPDAWLFLWIPRAHAFALHEVETEVTSLPDGEVIRARVAMPLGYAVAKAWGFDSYSTCAVWTKTDEEHPNAAGTGKIFRDQDELLLLFKRGQGLPMPEHKFGSNYRERPREHSRKPDFYREMIASMAGGLPVLELFARVDAEHPLPEGWGSWGNQSGEAPVDTETALRDAFNAAKAAREAERLWKHPAIHGLHVVSRTRDYPGGESFNVATCRCGWSFRVETKPFDLECDAATDAHWREVIASHQLPEPSGEVVAAAAEATDGASAAAAVAAPPYNAGDVVVIDQLAGSEWLSRNEVEALELSEREQLKILSDFCHPQRTLCSVLGPRWQAREMAYLGSGGEWSLRGAGWDRLRELEADERKAAAAADLTEPYRAPQMSFFDVARQIDDAPAPEVVDGALQTRLPVDDDELAEQLALLDIAAGRFAARSIAP